jgi:hypothetical protein
MFKSIHALELRKVFSTAIKGLVSRLHQLNKYVMHGISRNPGQRCSLRDVVGWINLVRSFQTSSTNQVQTDEARQARFH